MFTICNIIILWLNGYLLPNNQPREGIASNETKCQIDTIASNNGYGWKLAYCFILNYSLTDFNTDYHLSF